jgi:hypothetical protein
MTESQLIRWALDGNEEAIAFVDAVSAISQTWDDLIDRDCDVSPEAINSMMWTALVELPNNPFYARHFGRLNTLVQQVIVDYLTADKRVSFILRDSLAGLIVHCSLLIGGYDWANAVAPAVRRYIHDEDFQAYAGER